MKPSRGREQDGSGFQSNNLWVGSLTTDTTESDLSDLFGRFGEIDRITAYSSRSFAFIYYRRVEEAEAAKEALQGANLNGSQIKIEYARPVCSHLCVTLGFNCRLFLNFDVLLMVRSIIGNFDLDLCLFSSRNCCICLSQSKSQKTQIHGCRSWSGSERDVLEWAFS